MWREKDVLDFGGNIGNILKDPNSTINEERYWCIDITKQAIERGKATYPKSHWIFYDRYNFSFNPTGVPNLKIPSLGQKFDYIVAYSVFTNTRQSTMTDLVRQLENLLKPDGALAFTFIDPHYYSWPDRYNGNNLHWRLQRTKGSNSTLRVQKMLEKAEYAKWLILINDNDLYVENEDIKDYDLDQRESCYAFYSKEYMRTVFPQATILGPVNSEMQHCCVIGKT